MGNHLNYFKLDTNESIEKFCRICFEDADEKLISPCLCKGTSKYIHEECLKQWLRYQSEKILGSKCEICHHTYSIQIHSSKQLNFIINKTICTILFFYLIALIIIFGLALIPILYPNLFPYSEIVRIILTLASLFFFVFGIVMISSTLKTFCIIEKIYSWEIENYQVKKIRISLIHKLIGLAIS
jgi:hypothetical protein